MLHLPILRRGRPYRSVDVATVPHFRTRQPFADLSQANAGPGAPRPARGARRRRCAPSLAAFTVDAAGGHLPPRRRRRSCRTRCPWATRRRRPTTTCASSRPPPACPTSSCAATWRRSAACSRSWRPCSRASPAASTSSVLDRGMGEAHGHALSLHPALADPGRRPALQLAGRALALGAHDRPEDRPRPEAGQRRAVDALPAHPGLHQGGRAARGLRLLPHRPRGRGGDPAPTRPGHRLRRRGLDEALARRTRGSRCTAPATARSCWVPTPPRTGRGTST